MDESNKGWTSRGYLPHYDMYDTIQFITFRLYDSLPYQLIASWKEIINSNNYKGLSRQEIRKKKILVEKYARNGYGQCFLRHEKCANIVKSHILLGNKKDYELFEYVIMPNHVHVLIRTLDTSNLSNIVRRWKSRTAHEINYVLKRKGSVWMHGYYDTYIRNNEHLNHVVEYIRNN